MTHEIHLEDKTFVFLSHQDIINVTYKENGFEKYTLHPEIFDFQAKHTEASQLGDNKNVAALGISRKKRKKGNSQQQKHDATDTTLLTTCQLLRTQIKNLINKEISTKSVIPRIWEERMDFPNFKGANNTNTFQKLENLVKGKTFLIPPKTCFYNYNIEHISDHLAELEKYDLIVLDPPWRNKYIRRLKKHHIGYSMLENKHLLQIPMKSLLKEEQGIVAIWCTNCKQHQNFLLEELLPNWNLRLLHSVKWMKLNTLGEPISTPTLDVEQKQPYEMLYIACHKNGGEMKRDFEIKLKKVELILSVPSIIHSHKPPLLTWLQSYLQFDERPNCLELFARYLQPNFTSFGLEVLKLMDSRLYNENICSF